MIVFFFRQVLHFHDKMQEQRFKQEDTTEGKSWPACG